MNLGMVVHTCDSNTWEEEAGNQDLKLILSYIVLHIVKKNLKLILSYTVFEASLDYL